MSSDPGVITVREITDPAELDRMRAQQERADRNWAWFQTHATELYRSYRGKCLCISGEELFVADTPAEVLALAKAAHPEDDGRIVHYIHKEKLDRIYANQRRVDPV